MGTCIPTSYVKLPSLWSGMAEGSGLSPWPKKIAPTPRLSKVKAS